MTRRIRTALLGLSLLLGSFSLPFGSFLGSFLGSGMAAAHECAGEPTRARLGSHLFERADRDGNGSVELAEARAGALSLFEQLDTNRDGSVLHAEAEAALGRMRAERLEERFAKLDLDRDGVLGGPELAASKRSFLRFDANRDGVVTRAELRAVGAEQRGDQQGLGRGRSWVGRFETWDGDRDGRVTRSEVEREVTRSFIECDVNRDGALSAVEARGTRQRPGRARR